MPTSLTKVDNDNVNLSKEVPSLTKHLAGCDDIRGRLDKANEYFNKIPPQANTPEEIAAFFANLT